MSCERDNVTASNNYEEWKQNLTTFDHMLLNFFFSKTQGGRNLAVTFF